MMTRFEKVAHKSEFDAKAHRTLQEVSLFYPAWKSDLKALRTVEVFFADIASEFKNGKIEESARRFWVIRFIRCIQDIIFTQTRILFTGGKYKL